MSSRSTTPVGRGRSEDIGDASDGERGVVHSHRDKRRRLGTEGSYSSDEELSLRDGITPQQRSASQSISDDDTDLYGASRSPERPVLPDSFLRSPGGLSNRPGISGSRVGPRTHQPGAIVRVKLTDFVTYTNAEFKPGPSLNMIIGPNGTGKSTLVCAICLGLGWKTSHLGRAKDIAEFVKHGQKTATIEIELAADPIRQDKNPVITTKISRETNKAEYSVDGRKVSSKALQELMSSFSIQIDNLCQFLPQDRVVEFAALSPVDLLTQTQKAAAPEQMTIWHEQLKVLRREQKTKEQKHVDLQADVKHLENRQRLQAADVERLRQRTELQARLAALEKLRPFSDYNHIKVKYDEGKKRKRQAQQELARLKDQMEPNLRAVNAKEEYVAGVDSVKLARTRLVERTHEHIQTIQRNHSRKDDEIRDREKELQTEKDQIKQHIQDRPRLKGNVQRLEHALQNAPPEYDTTAVNDKLQEFSRQLRECEDQASDLTESMHSQVEQARQRTAILNDLKQQKARLQTQAGQQEQKLKQANPEVARAWEWMKQNRNRFEGEIFGPAILECTVKDESHAGAVEAAIGNAELLAVTVTDPRDFRMLYKQLYEELKLENVFIRTSTTPLAQFAAPISSDVMRSLGLECWLLELIEGPEPVLAMLCDNRNLHAHGFTTRSISQAQYDALVRTNLGAWSTPKERYSVARRREYGDQGSSVRSVELRPARFFKDAPADYQMDGESRRKEQELEEELEQLRLDLDEKKKAVAKLKEQSNTLTKERDEVQREKNARQSELAQFRALPLKLEQAQQKLADLNDKIHGAASKQQDLMDSALKLAVEKGQIAVDLANAVDNLQTLHTNLLEAELISIEAHSELEQCQARHERELGMLQEIDTEVKTRTEEVKRVHARAREMEKECQTIGSDLSENEVHVFDEISSWMPDQLETEIQSVSANFEMTAGNGNQRTIQEFEERAQQLERKQEHLSKLSERLSELEQEIAVIRSEWEPRLDALVEQISGAFAENFSQIQCAGEVGVYKDDDFEQWAIQIKVKFRETEQLSILDSHRQSGGERAVSTIFYLMALQSLARVPFRVVDEINQGMDPRNERLVHSRMVDIACADDSASQYFLITPKLLNGLKYHPNMKVHCIASGEYMPEDHRQLDFGALAQKALAVRHAQMATSAA